MSQENVEIVRRLYESGAVDGNYDALREVLDPEAVYVNPPEAVDPGTRRGIEEIMASAESVSKSFRATEHKVRALFDAGEAVVASVTAHAWGRDSGAQVTQEEAHTWTLRDGKVISFEWSRDLPAALEAVGLSE
jgi:ketosteroid isomerase-like protein